MMKRLMVWGGLTALMLTGSLSSPAAAEEWWDGFEKMEFKVDDRRCQLFAPKEAAPGNPWIWRLRFLGHAPQVDVALLKKGFHVAWIDVSDLFGAPVALDHMDQFYQHLTHHFNLSTRPVLEGLSRGGLFAFNWAARHPDQVAAIYGDLPVCDFKSWPGGKGKGEGSPNDWKNCLEAYGMTEAEAMDYKMNPVDNLAPLAQAKIPILCVAGDADTIVPIEENTWLVEKRYQELGGEIEVILKPGCGHGPHSLPDPTAIVDFAVKHSLENDQLPTSVANEGGKENFHIYLLMGQSNMVGHGGMEPRDREPHPRAFSLNSKNLWVPAINPLHKEGGVGLGLTFAKNMADADDSIIVGLVPCAVNGSGLNQWEKGGGLYNKAMARAKRAMQKGTIKGILWHQGESDSDDPKNAETYAARYEQMILDVRRELGNDHLPVVAGQLGPFWLAVRPHAEKINRFFADIDTHIPASACALSEGLTDQGDNCHFNGDSLRVFGVRYAEQMQKLQKGIPPDPGADAQPPTTPWDLEELNKPPVFEWAEGKDIRSLYFNSEPYKGKTTRVFAYYATPGTLSGDPAKDTNLPAVVLVHGGGGKAFPQWAKLWAERGYAAIAMDLAGNGPNGPLADGGPGQGDDEKFGAIGEPITDQWTYHAVANVIRAHSLIRSFPEVDPERTATTGISWGGYLTCIVAGLDPRFKAAVPIYGCGFLHENSAWLNQFEKMSPENKAKWIRLWDPSRYVGSTTVPMLFVNGGCDFAYPPDSHARTYALVQSPKNIRIVPNLGHGHIFDRPQAVEVFIRSHLEDGIPLARIVSMNIGDERVTAHVDTKTPLVKAEMHYTLDALPGTRKWVTKPAVVEDHEIISERPPRDSTIWFLTVEDERNTIVSSQLVFPGGPQP